MSSRCLPQYGELQPTNGWDRFISLWHPNKFQRVSRLAFVTAATSLNGGQPNFARSLSVLWASTVCIHFRELLPLTEFCQVQKSLRPSHACVLVYWQRYCTALQQRASANLCGMVQVMELRDFSRGRHLYSARRPSCWASAHIIVLRLTCSAKTFTYGFVLAHLHRQKSTRYRIKSKRILCDISTAVVGCVNPTMQPGMKMTRNRDVITISCDVTGSVAASRDDSIWQMTCVNNQWIGYYGNCSDGTSYS